MAIYYSGNFYIVLVIFIMFCGNAQTLPQDWPCDKFTLYPVEKTEDHVYNFKDTSSDYEVAINELNLEFPYAYCGNAGCYAKILKCERISGDEYIFTKFSDNEYRVELCDGKKYLYILKSECEGCSCSLRDSDPEAYISWHMNCLQEDDKLHCFTFHGYYKWRNFKNEIEDYKNCVGLRI